ncbi:UNVERIFIED_CONTAM: hypothetical protein GTU68_051882, partial [Idotea baltica]|nr:hypothetical protein [Idotea baltica]
VKISEDQVEYLAKLSAIQISPDEKSKLLEDLNSIVEKIELLAELRTEGVPATSHVYNTNNVFREDLVGSSFSQQQALQISPSSGRGCIRVPKVI